MKFGRKLQAIYFACIGFIQVVTGFDITINGSQPYYVVGRPFMFTCTFDSTAVAVRILQKNNVKVQSVQLSGADCYNVQIAPAVICDPTFCSCSQQGNTFTASWNFTVSDTQTNTWKCVEGSSQSPDFPVKPAVSCNTVTLTKEQDISYVGQDIKLSCVTDGCRPRAHIQWYIGNKNSTENATATVTTTNSTEELVRVESKLTLTAAIDLNEQTVSCVAWNFDPSVYVMANGTLNVTSSAGPTTEPPESTSPPLDKCDCPALPCVGENGFCVLWIIIIIVVVVVLVAVICIVWIVCRRRQKQKKIKNTERKTKTNKKNNLELNKNSLH